jgi:cytidine deaminase
MKNISNKLNIECMKAYDLAVEAKKNAYSPYSNFQVGASVLLKDGNIITGCNVENASYGLTMCAERVAIFNAISKGYIKGDIVAVAISASSDNFSPCGACRQVIREFGEDILIVFEYDGKVEMSDISTLLPYSFTI